MKRRNFINICHVSWIKEDYRNPNYLRRIIDRNYQFRRVGTVNELAQSLSGLELTRNIK